MRDARQRGSLKGRNAVKGIIRIQRQGHACVLLHACVHKGIDVPACAFCAYMLLCVLVRRVCLLKSSNGVTAVLQLCPSCEKPSMIGKIYGSVLCSGSGADLNLPLSFFFHKEGLWKA